MYSTLLIQLLSILKTPWINVITIIDMWTVWFSKQ